MSRILIADDNNDMCEVLSKSLAKRGYSVATSPDGADALERVKHETFDVVLADLRMPVLDGMGLLKRVKEVSPATIVIMITAYGTVEDAVEAMRHSAFDYVLKPFSTDEIEVKIRKALDHKRIEEERRLLREEDIRKRGGLVCKSEPMQDINAQIDLYAKTRELVMICGKSGTGKELVAREIHRRSERSDGPFVSINCVALDPLVQELEFFGCERGVRDDMPEGRKGKIEAAEGGTIFIDEVCELNRDSQDKLLAFLQSGRLKRVGGTEEMHPDVRVIVSSSNRPEEVILRGDYNLLLIEKFKACNIDLPELRERQADIDDLAEYFVERYSAEFHKHVRLSPEALGILKDHTWPGNVHELENVIARAVIVSRGEQILPSHLPTGIAGPVAGVKADAYRKHGVASQLDAIEREVIRNALEKEGWNQSHAARRLGMKRTTLQYKLKKYGISRQAR
jgi:DNA-binding NtrC family response regulator